ncbi:hypothetical protein [Vibrio scophthalmi]|uniref:Uncharacterized protein n=1 Tax=Vibrio scophthalmi TaxID=45658 RepID=A0A1E3WNH3_9VIBR|nr:hypothetical protein [Vibrio scophthalmi]ODS10532.1 hypothetical protein VSF3289_00791 [Vibrio scophthalmi]
MNTKDSIIRSLKVYRVLGAYLCHAYALTVFSSQGTTVDGDTFTLYSGRMAQREFHVALSCHKDESHVYINEEEINEHLKAIKEDVEITDEIRHTTLATLINQESQYYLEIEYLKREKQ